MSVSTIYPSENKPEHDFDLLVILARKDPFKFEEQREKMIQDFIDSQAESNRESLSRFQWRIDQMRSRAKNPIHALMKINAMMWDSLSELEIAQNQLVDCIFDQQAIEEVSCEVIDLNEYKKNHKRTKEIE